MRRITVLVFFLAGIGPLISGEYLVIYKQRMLANATPAVVECEELEVFPGYAKASTKGKPDVEIKSGAWIAMIPKKDYNKIAEIAKRFPDLEKRLSEIQSRWKSEREAIEAAHKRFQEAAAAEIVHGEGARTLDGRIFRGVVRASTKYGITISTEEGISSIGMAELCTSDLKKWDKTDRTGDGRFWYERSLAIMKAQEAGKEVAAEAQEAGAHLDDCHAYLKEKELARKKRALDNYNARIAAENKMRNERAAQAQALKAINERLDMEKTDSPPKQNESAGEWPYSTASDLEQQLRDAMETGFLQAN